MIRKLKIVIDTNVLISAFNYNGLERELLKLASNNQLDIFTSDELFNEFSEVLSRPKFKLTLPEQIYALKSFQTISTLLKVTEKVTVCRDSDDNKVLECALACGANFLVTGDKDLLVLKEFRSTKIVTTRELLEVLK